MVRTRFAPSPTGYLHVGGARTALYCWLYAKKTHGTFILRIEDTDLERSTPESVQAILDGMTWLNLTWDEGPFYQTKRFERYKAVIDELLADGKAYRCYCSKERLESLRAEQLERKEKPRYDGKCRHLSQTQDGPFVIRFKNPETGAVTFEDLVRGQLSFQNTELDDLIIARSDGSPTYNFTVVVDDIDMHVTHVIRGDDHINNTPRQINLIQALGEQVPLYAHLPMILGSDGKRLSKRHGAVGVMQYRDDGYLPQALINYLARLGWSHGDQEIFSMDELIQHFDLVGLNRSAAAFNPEKLLWLNHHYIKTLPPEEVVKHLVWHLDNLKINTQDGPSLVEIVKIQAERTKTLKEMAERSRYFFEEFEVQDILQHFAAEQKDVLIAVRDRLQTLTTWTKDNIHQVISDVATASDLKMGKVAQPLRIAITGGTISPPIDSTIQLIGKERIIERLDNVINAMAVY